MNKVNGYDVVITRGTPRFRLDNKLIKRELVPIDVQQTLLAMASDKDAVRTVAPAPDVEATFTQEQPTSAPVELDDEPADNPYVEALAAGEGDSFPIDEPAQPLQESMNDVPAFSELELQLLQENDKLKRDLAEVNELTFSPKQPDTAQQLGTYLVNDYGIYTALSPRDPQIGDIHPFTLRPMNRYDVGLAYAERKRSIGQDVLPVEEVPLPQENQPTDFPSFADRTGVSFKRNQTSSILQHHTNDPISDEATAEPNLRGTTIRPYW